MAASLIGAMVEVSAQVGGKAGFRTGFVRWRARDGAFASWERAGTALAADGTLLSGPGMQQGSDEPGAYHGHSFYNGGDYCVGEATSPAVPADFRFAEAIASWNVETPEGTWIEALLRAQVGGRWSTWYNMGVWAAGTSTLERHSAGPQSDADGRVAADTAVVSDTAGAAALQLKLRLFSADGHATPVVRNAAVALSTAAGKPLACSSGAHAPNVTLDVPACSQMVYPDGGRVWCSPTSVSMVLGYWNGDRGPCEARVRAAVTGVYDWLYDGHGNWAFNTAYAATHGLEAYVARMAALDQVEPWIAAGVPVVMSDAWEDGELSGAPVSSSNGHLVVLVGFDRSGNPIVNDPAAASDDVVRRTYDRGEFESVWLRHSAGTVYLIYPPGTAVPA